jgi:hypothetical protein
VEKFADRNRRVFGMVSLYLRKSAGFDSFRKPDIAKMACNTKAFSY